MSVMTASSSARERHRWLLLTGWFTLFSALLSFVIAAPPRATAADGIIVLIAMLGFIAYSAAMKRYWIALALVSATVVATLFALQ